MPIFDDELHFFDHLSLDILYRLMFAQQLFSPFQCSGSLELKAHTVGLEGHARTLEERTWEIGFADSFLDFFFLLFCFYLLRPGSVWPALSGSDRSSACDSTVGRDSFGMFLRYWLVASFLLPQHREERGNCVPVEIPCFTLGRLRGLWRGENIWVGSANSLTFL